MNPLLVLIVINGKVIQELSDPGVLFHLGKRFRLSLIVALLTTNKAGILFKTCIIRLSRGKGIEGNELFHAVAHAVLCLFAVPFVNQPSILLDQSYHILAGLLMLRLDNTTKIGQYLSFRNTDFCPFLILHILGLFLMAELVEIFLTLGIFVYQFGVGLDMEHQLPHFILERIVAPTHRRQLNAGTVAPHPLSGRGNDFLTDDLKQLCRVIHVGQIEPVGAVQSIRFSLVGSVQLLLPKEYLGSVAIHAKRFERILLNGDLTQEREIFCQFGNFRAVQIFVGQERRRHHNRHNAQRLQQLRRFQAVVHLRDDLATLRLPFQIERRVAHYIVKPHIRLIETDITVFQISGGVKIVRYFVGLDVQLTAVEVCLQRHEVTEVGDARGEVCYRFVHSRGQCLHDKLAKSGRRKELTVLDLLLGLRILMIVGKVRAFQAMQSTVSGIGIIDILAGDSRLFGQILVYQIEDLVVQLLSGFLGNRFIKVLILHSFTCSIFLFLERGFCAESSQNRAPHFYYRKKRGIANQSGSFSYLIPLCNAVSKKRAGARTRIIDNLLFIQKTGHTVSGGSKINLTLPEQFIRKPIDIPVIISHFG